MTYTPPTLTRDNMTKNKISKKPTPKNLNKNVGGQFEKLVEIMATLRGPDGCPWDKEQTYKNINPYMLEEVHEVMEAIDANNMDGLKEELGDLLLHIVFHAQMANEDGFFDVNDVIKGICEKLIYRHPHVFGGKKVKDSDEVLSKWEQLKKSEKNKKHILSGVPQELPSLLKAFRLGEKAGRVGFDWQNADGILKKLQEEIKELFDAQKHNSPTEIEHEYGDILFTLANIGRFLKVNPEEALRRATNRFIKRFSHMEDISETNGKKYNELTPKEWDELWNQAKKIK